MSDTRRKRLAKELRMVRADEDIVDFVHIPADGDIGKWEVFFYVATTISYELFLRLF